MYALSVAKMEWFKFILQFCIESVSTTTQAAFAGFAAELEYLKKCPTLAKVQT